MFPVEAIRLVLDTTRKSGWNEIDAVELLGPGDSQWAQRATASSTYAQRARDQDRIHGMNGVLERPQRR